MEEDKVRGCLDAIDNHNCDEIRRLLAYDEVRNEIERLLNSAVWEGSDEIFELLAAVATKLNLDEALCVAAFHGNLQSARWLLNHGASFESLNDGIKTSDVLETAANQGHVEIVKLLLELGAIAYSDLREKAKRGALELLQSMSLKSQWECRCQTASMSAAKIPGEQGYLASAADNLTNETNKLNYASWLDSQGDPRGEFLRKFVEASRTMNFAEFPDSQGLPSDWLRMIGYEIVLNMARLGFPAPQPSILKQARPALKLLMSYVEDRAIRIGGSKVGGLPDLPSGTAWPKCRDCTVSYCEPDPSEFDELCGFLAQFNCEELSRTLAGRRLPSQGLISLFWYANFDISTDGLRILYDPDTSNLERRNAPENLSEGTAIRPTRAVWFAETLSLPHEESPWRNELQLEEHRLIDAGDGSYNSLRPESEMLGYYTPRNSEEITPDVDTELFLSIDLEDSYAIHIQIDSNDLRAGNFDNVRLPWISY